MPEVEEKKMVDIDTSGPGAEIEVSEEKDESVVETEAPKEEAVPTDQEPVKKETLTEEPKKDDEKWGAKEYLKALGYLGALLGPFITASASASDTIPSSFVSTSTPAV